MKNIIVDKDITNAIHDIKKATGPIFVELYGHSCGESEIFKLITLRDALKACKHETTLISKDCVSLIPFVGADKIKISAGDFIDRKSVV